MPRRSAPQSSALWLTCSNLWKASFWLRLIQICYHPWVGIVGLTIAAWMGNVLRLPLFFGVDFLFGSIAVMLVLNFYGVTVGVLAAAIAGSYTWIAWEHPWAMIIVILEGLWVGLGLKRGYRNLLLIDLAYWVPFGMIFVSFFYGKLLGFSSSSTLLVALKQGLNGIFNALIASIISNFISTTFLKNRQAYQPSFQQVVFTWLAFATMTPLLLITIVTGYNNLQNLEAEIWSTLEVTSSTVQQNIENWYKESSVSIASLARQAAALIIPETPENKKDLNTFLVILKSIVPDLNQIYTVNEQGNLIVAVPPSPLSEKLLNIPWNNQNIFEQVKRQKKVIISEILADNDKTYLEIGIAAPILSGNTFNGMIYGIFGLTELENILKREVLGENINVVLLGANDRVIVKNVEQSSLSLAGGEIIGRRENRFHWLPYLPGKSIMSRWRQSFYAERIPLEKDIPWTIFIINLMNDAFGS